MSRRLLVIALPLVVAAAAIAFVFGAGRRGPTPVATRGYGEPRASADEDQLPRGEVSLDTRRQQLIGVRTVRVQRSTMAPEIRATGTVAYDETRQTEINTKVDGWIRDLYADYTGRPVRTGEPLFTLYSHDLLAAEDEYLLALRGQQTQTTPDLAEYSARLVDAARERLRRLDLSDEDIDAVRASGRPLETITFRSPAAGVILEKAALRGMRVMAGQMLYRVADLSSVWVEADTYETDLPSVRLGAIATIALQAYPDRTFTGRVSYIYPSINEPTRTARVRIALSNPSGLLKPNMLATVTLKTPPSSALLLPADAVVDTGTQQLVFVAEGEGRFTPRDVRIGRRTADAVEVLSGVKDGDEVAASATFFLDSESQLRGALQNYDAGSAVNVARNPAHDAASAVDVTFRTDPDPPRGGENTVIVTAAAGGQPIVDATVTAVFFLAPMPTMNMPAERTETTLAAAGGGTYRGTATLMSAGRWDVRVTVTQNGRTLGARQFAAIVR